MNLIINFKKIIIIFLINFNLKILSSNYNTYNKSLGFIKEQEQIFDPSSITSIKDIIKLKYHNPEKFKIITRICSISNLKYLDLSNKNLSDLSDISKLEVNHENEIFNITNLPNNTFESEYKLSLNLRNNKLVNIPLELSELKNIAQIGLGNNKLINLNKVLSLIKTLEGLYIYNNSINKVDFDNWNDSSIKILDLSNNNIEYIPNNIENLTNLTCLNLDNNKLNFIHDNISKLKLEEISLRNNNLEKSPNLNSNTLIIIYLNNNKIKNIDNINNMKFLELLDLSDNHIHKLPKNFNLPNIKYLALMNNYIKDITPISNLKELKFISASNNKIESIKLKNPTMKAYYIAKTLFKNLSNSCIDLSNEINNYPKLKEFSQKFKQLSHYTNNLFNDFCESYKNNSRFNIEETLFTFIDTLFKNIDKKTEKEILNNKYGKKFQKSIKNIYNASHQYTDEYGIYFWPENLELINLCNNSLTKPINFINPKEKLLILLWDNEIEEFKALKGTEMVTSGKIVPEILYLIYTFINPISQFTPTNHPNRNDIKQIDYIYFESE